MSLGSSSEEFSKQVQLRFVPGTIHSLFLHSYHEIQGQKLHVWQQVGLMGVWMSEQNGLVFHNEEKKRNEP